MVAIIGLITFVILYIANRRKSVDDINIMARYIHVALYRRYGNPNERKRWLSPITKHVSDYETYYFDPRRFKADE